MSAPEFGSLRWFWAGFRHSPRGALVDFLMWTCPPVKNGRLPRGYHTLFRILIDKEAMRREFEANPEIQASLAQSREDSAAGRVYPYRPGNQ